MNNTELFDNAQEIAKEIEEYTRLIAPDSDDDTILKLAIYTVDRVKLEIPMYTGNLNPKWKLYDTVYMILRERLNSL